MKDLQFTYKYNIRHILINKLGHIKNEMNIPFIKKLIFLINIRNIENVDERQIYNYFYLFKFFLGRKTYITKNKKIYHLGK
jgi:ribosomal protein L5